MTAASAYCRSMQRCDHWDRTAHALLVDVVLHTIWVGLKTSGNELRDLAERSDFFDVRRIELKRRDQP